MICIYNKEEMNRAIKRLAFEAVEQNGTDFALVGIRTRGVLLALRMREEIKKSEGITLPVGILDITLYRDDLLSENCDAVFKGSEIGFDIDGKKIVLCDDVLYTGRTARAALAALNSMGRAKSVKLFCLVDRGHRELPFYADGAGKRFPTSKEEKVVARFEEIDEEDGVFLLKKGERKG